MLPSGEAPPSRGSPRPEPSPDLEARLEAAVAAGAPEPASALAAAPAGSPARRARAAAAAAAPPANAAPPAAAAAAARTPGPRAPRWYAAIERSHARGPGAAGGYPYPWGPGPTRGDVVPWGQTPAGDWVALPSAGAAPEPRAAAAQPPPALLAPPPALLAPPPVLVLAPATALRLAPWTAALARESGRPPSPASDDGSAAGAARGAKRPRSAEGGGSAEPKAKRTRERWTAREHELFLDGLERFGKKWKLIKELIPTKTVTQVRTHANGHFSKMLRRTVGKPDALEVSHALLALRSIAG